MSDPEVITKEDIDQHLITKLIPYVTCQYESTKKVNATLGQLIADLISAVEKTKAQDQVLLLNNYWMRLSMISLIIKTKVCVICQSRRPRKIIQTLGFNNSGYQAKPEFNNCFIIHLVYISKKILNSNEGPGTSERF